MTLFAVSQVIVVACLALWTTPRFVSADLVLDNVCQLGRGDTSLGQLSAMSGWSNPALLSLVDGRYGFALGGHMIDGSQQIRPGFLIDARAACGATIAGFLKTGETTSVGVMIGSDRTEDSFRRDFEGDNSYQVFSEEYDIPLVGGMVSHAWGDWGLGGAAYLSRRTMTYSCDSFLANGTLADRFMWCRQAMEVSLGGGGVYRSGPLMLAVSGAFLDRPRSTWQASGGTWQGRLGSSVQVMAVRLLAEYEVVPYHSYHPLWGGRVHAGSEIAASRILVVRAGVIYSRNWLYWPDEIRSTDMTVGASCTVGRFRFDVAYLLERLGRNDISLGITFGR